MESTYDWYAARNSAAAHGFREELRQAVATVVASPQTWTRYGTRARRYVFPRYPYSLVYVIRGSDIEVVAVAMAGDGPDTGGHGSETRSNRSRHGAVHNLVRRAKPFPRLLPSSGAEKFESPSLTDRTRLSGPAIFSGGGNEESTPCQAGPQGSLRG